MEDLDRYRQIIRDIIQEYAQYKPSRGDVQVEVIFDVSNDHYELVHALVGMAIIVYTVVLCISTFAMAKSDSIRWN